jgi:NDP-sugar pyrophosphorylase family protein
MNAVLFSGGPGTDICPEAWDRPRPLWPIGGGLLLDHCLDALRVAGVRRVVIASNGSTAKLTEHLASATPPDLHIELNEDHRPRGSAGSLADAARKFADGKPILLVSAASFLSGLDLGEFVAQSLASDAVLTVGYVPDASQDVLPGVYFVKPAALAKAKRVGYQDLKEQLIPSLRREGLRVAALPLSGVARPVLTKDHCLQGLLGHIRASATRARLRHLGYVESAPDVWVHESAEVDATARLLGPSVIGPNVRIMADAVISGPVVLEHDVIVERDAIVDHSILFAGSRVAAGAVLQNLLRQIGTPARAPTRGPAKERSERRRVREAGASERNLRKSVPSA